MHGYAKQGAGFGYTGVRGLNALLATVTTGQAAPVIVAQRLRKGVGGLGPRRAAAGPRRAGHGAAAARPAGDGPVLLRADSAFYGHATIGAAVRAGAAGVGHGADGPQRSKRAIAGIAADAWTTIEYTDAVYDEDTGRWISRAEVAEVPFTAFSSRTEGRAGRRPARRAPHPRPQPEPSQPARPTLFDLWRFHAFFTTSDLDTVTADQTHRGHAIIETGQRRPEELGAGPPALRAVHRQRGLAGLRRDGVQPHPRRRHPHAAAALAKATTATIRRTLITVPARIATSARRLTLHLPTGWPWQTRLDRALPTPADSPHQPPDLTVDAPPRRPRSISGEAGQTGDPALPTTATHRPTSPNRRTRSVHRSIGGSRLRTHGTRLGGSVSVRSPIALAIRHVLPGRGRPQPNRVRRLCCTPCRIASRPRSYAISCSKELLRLDGLGPAPRDTVVDFGDGRVACVVTTRLVLFPHRRRCAVVIEVQGG